MSTKGFVWLWALTPPIPRAGPESQIAGLTPFRRFGSVMDQPFKSIIGQQLTAVVFVMYYVQLQFGGPRPVLTAITLPTVKTDQGEFRPEVPGYRDRLCERIAGTVRQASVSEGEEVRIDLDDGTILSISLKPEDYRTAEAAIFDNGPDDYWVW